MALLFCINACGDDADPASPEDEVDAESDAGATGSVVRDASKPRDARADSAPATSVDAAGDEAVEDAAIADASIQTSDKDASVRDAGRVADAGQIASDAGVSVCDALTYASFGQQFLSTYCVSCHGSPIAQKNIHLDSLAGVVAAKSKVKAETSSSAMPPRGSKAPTSAERKQLSQWIDCGPK